MQGVGNGNEKSVQFINQTIQDTHLRTQSQAIITLPVIQLATSSLKLIHKTSVLHIPLRFSVDSLAGTVKVVDMETFMLVSSTMYSSRMPLWSIGGSSIQDTDAVVLESAMND